MPPDLPAKPETHPRWLLRRLDQAGVAVAVLFCLAAMILWWISQGGLSNRLVEVDRADPGTVRFEVDVNSAGWPELVQLPGVGETLAKRIVDSREKDGPFLDHGDLRRVRGIGPKTLEKIRPYLRPMPEGAAVAGN
jgi:competence protein ComEA